MSNVHIGKKLVTALISIGVALLADGFLHKVMGETKNAQLLNEVERGAVQRLLMMAYDEAFAIDTKLRMFMGTKIYRNPRNLDQALDPPIYTASIISHTVDFDPDEARRKLRPILAKKVVSWPADGGGRHDLQIIDYEIDYTPGTGNAITVIPLQVSIRRVPR